MLFISLLPHHFTRYNHYHNIVQINFFCIPVHVLSNKLQVMSMTSNKTLYLLCLSLNFHLIFFQIYLFDWPITVDSNSISTKTIQTSYVLSHYSFLFQIIMFGLKYLYFHRPWVMILKFNSVF